MTLEDFLKENPDAQAMVDAMKEDAKREGVQAERQRLQELDEIAKSVSAQALEDAKYGEKPTDAKELSFQAMKDDTIRAASYMAQAVADAQTSGASEVGLSGEDPDEDGNEEELLSNYINKRKGRVK